MPLIKQSREKGQLYVFQCPLTQQEAAPTFLYNNHFRFLLFLTQFTSTLLVFAYNQ